MCLGTCVYEVASQACACTHVASHLHQDVWLTHTCIHLTTSNSVSKVVGLGSWKRGVAAARRLRVRAELFLRSTRSRGSHPASVPLARALPAVGAEAFPSPEASTSPQAGKDRQEGEGRGECLGVEAGVYTRV